MSPQEKQKAKKVVVIKDVRVECEFGLDWYDRQSEEHRIKALQREIDSFHNFVKDHRSQDHITLNMVKDYEDQCSVCGALWETYEEIDGVFCASCGTDTQ